MNQLFERVRKILRAVERAVKSHRKSSGRAHQSARTLEVYTGIGSQRTSYDPGDTHASGFHNVTRHCSNLVIRIDEAASSGTNHHEHRQLRLVEHFGDQCGARSGAAIAEVRAKLETVGTIALGNEGGFE